MALEFKPWDNSKLSGLIDEHARPQEWRPPNIFDPNSPRDQYEMVELLSTGRYETVRSLGMLAVDISEILVPSKRELDHRETMRQQIIAEGDGFGRWVADHHERTLTQIADPATHFRVRTARNLYLRTPEEQQELYRGIRIATLGQSVGSNVLASCVYTGIGDTHIIVDFDRIGSSNLNRIPARNSNVGERKVVTSANRIVGIDPYIMQHHFYQGATDETFEQIFALKPNVVVEAIDGIRAKYIARKWAKKTGTPLIMPTDLGYGAILDVERYDIEDNVEPFAGRIDDKGLVTLENTKKLTQNQKGSYAAAIIGPYTLPARLAASLIEIDNTLPGIAQLNVAALQAAATATNAIQRIILGHDLPSGRYRPQELTDLNDLI